MATAFPGLTIRRHQRYRVYLQVDYSTRDAFLSNLVCNLSRGGMFIASSRPLPIGSEIDLKLALPGDACIRARARVVWNFDIRRGTLRVIPGMGIRFTAISVADRRRLEGYLESLASTLARPTLHGPAPRGPARAARLVGTEPVPSVRPLSSRRSRS